MCSTHWLCAYPFTRLELHRGVGHFKWLTPAGVVPVWMPRQYVGHLVVTWWSPGGHLVLHVLEVVHVCMESCHSYRTSDCSVLLVEKGSTIMARTVGSDAQQLSCLWTIITTHDMGRPVPQHTTTIEMIRKAQKWKKWSVDIRQWHVSQLSRSNYAIGWLLRGNAF